MRRIQIPTVLSFAALSMLATSMLPFSAQSAPQKLLSASSVTDIVSVSSPHFSADGETLCWSKQGVSTESDQQVASIWCKDGDAVPKAFSLSNGHGARSVQFIGNQKKISWIGFDEETGSQQVFMGDLQSGEINPVTTFARGVSDFSWSPDGKKLVVAASNLVAVTNEAGTPAPIEVDRFNYIGPWSSYVSDQPDQLFIVDLETSATQQITDTEFSHWHLKWSPDGTNIAYFSFPDFAAEKASNSELYLYSVAQGSSRQFTHSEEADGMAYWPEPLAWSADGKQLVWVERTPADTYYYGQKALLKADVATGKISPVARIDRNFDSPVFAADGQSIYALQEDNMSQWLVNIDLADNQVKPLNKGPQLTSGFAISPDEERIVVVAENDQAPAELIEINSKQSLTNNNEWLSDYAVAPTEQIQISHDNVTIDALVTLPANSQPGKPLPAIVLLHGGPVFQFFHQFSIDAQTYAANGFAVVQINPRGSSGKGLDFSLPIFNNWGAPDVDDVLAVVDGLAEQGVIDKSRLGIGGWSYGGILTNWTIAKSEAFKAAVSGAGVSAVLGFYGNDVFSSDYEQELGTPWANTDNYLRYSYPLLNADRITTPTLFQCAGIDSTVPCMGAKQMYLAMKSQNKPTHLTMYPNQGHMLTTPSYIEHRLSQSLAWFQQYLVKDASSETR